MNAEGKPTQQARKQPQSLQSLLGLSEVYAVGDGSVADKTPAETVFRAATEDNKDDDPVINLDGGNQRQHTPRSVREVKDEILGILAHDETLIYDDDENSADVLFTETELKCTTEHVGISDYLDVQGIFPASLTGHSGKESAAGDLPAVSGSLLEEYAKSQQMSEMRATIQQLEADKKALAAQLEIVRTKNDTDLREVQSLNSEYIRQLTGELVQLRQQNSLMEKENLGESLRQKNVNTSGNKKPPTSSSSAEALHLEDRMTALSEEAASYRSEVQESKLESNRFRMEIARYKGEVDKSSSLVESLRAELATAEREIRQLTARAESSTHDSDARVQGQEVERKRLEERLRVVSMELVNKSDAYERVYDDAAHMERRLAHVENENMGLRRRCADADSMETDLLHFRRRSTAMQAELRDLSDENARLRSMISSLHARSERLDASEGDQVYSRQTQMPLPPPRPQSDESSAGGMYGGYGGYQPPMPPMPMPMPMPAQAPDGLGFSKYPRRPRQSIASSPLREYKGDGVKDMRSSYGNDGHGTIHDTVGAEGSSSLSLRGSKSKSLSEILGKGSPSAGFESGYSAADRSEDSTEKYSPARLPPQRRSYGGYDDYDKYAKRSGRQSVESRMTENLRGANSTVLTSPGRRALASPERRAAASIASIALPDGTGAAEGTRASSGTASGQRFRASIVTYHNGVANKDRDPHGSSAQRLGSSNAPFGTDENKVILTAEYDVLESRLTDLTRERGSLQVEGERLHQRGCKTLKERTRMTQIEARMGDIGKQIAELRRSLAGKPQ
jgi:hypothetical protein